MEKKYRDYIRHFEKLDFDVISEEEIWEEREGLELRLTEIHYEMMRMMIPMMAFVICACIFLAAGFNGFFIGNFIGAGVFAALSAVFFSKYKTLSDVVKKLAFYMDKLT
ncbi:MAG: hypothetical protein K6G10_10780 [Butyrivibrio sp.]|nr:hypothetical protein [Butyrivibrio sp.]